MKNPYEDVEEGLDEFIAERQRLEAETRVMTHPETLWDVFKRNEMLRGFTSIELKSVTLLGDKNIPQDTPIASPFNYESGELIFAADGCPFSVRWHSFGGTFKLTALHF